MTSESSCFVYLQMPLSLEVVTCGRFVLTRVAPGAGRGQFIYGRSYRSRTDAVPIDPIELPITPETYETARLGGVFGVLRDASPDAWGRLVIERVLGKSDLNEVELLLQSPEDRAGALSFGLGAIPPAPVREFNRVVELAELREAARVIDEGASTEAIREQIRRVLEPTTSMGGARPKNTVEDDAGLWLAKFPGRDDRWNNAAVEAAMLALAARCDIRVPETRIERVGDESILLLRRFDREKVDGGYYRHRMASALTLLEADDTAKDRSKWSYLLMADELQRWSSRPVDDKAELFRRVVFNALISNNDDHPRNHAVVAAGRDWRLAPAYDLTPNPQAGREERSLALVCGSFGRAACRENLTSSAPRFGLDVEEAEAVIERMIEVIRNRWRVEVLSHGGSERDCEEIAPAFVHSGFEYPAVRG
ncbi:MAG TPA: type II toxin-antitoxin system HipA family toxin [Gemmatimonadaceae bacterium]|nr:type II toxin-antitoxin system HipA family toxin [Gemmatimonadaceae bacterium]